MAGIPPPTADPNATPPSWGDPLGTPSLEGGNRGQRRAASVSPLRPGGPDPVFPTPPPHQTPPSSLSVGGGEGG